MRLHACNMSAGTACVTPSVNKLNRVVVIVAAKSWDELIPSLSLVVTASVVRQHMHV